MSPDAGLLETDAGFDFSVARRRRASRLSQRLLLAPGDVNVILPFDDVVQASKRGPRVFRIGT